MPQQIPAVIKPAAGNSKAAPTDVIIINDNIIMLAVTLLQAIEGAFNVKVFFYFNTECSEAHLYLFFPLLILS